MTTNTTTARTIAEQIGSKAFFMIGAKNLVASENGLTFKVGRNTKGVSHIRVTLTPEDLYKMEFISVRGTSVKTKAEVEGIYFDMLNKMIEANTGLYTSL